MEGNSIIIQFGKKVNEAMVHFWNVMCNIEISPILKNRLFNSKGYPRFVIIDDYLSDIDTTKIDQTESNEDKERKEGKEKEKEKEGKRSTSSNVDPETWLNDLFFKLSSENIINLRDKNSSSYMDDIEECLRKQAEDCDELDSIVIVADVTLRNSLIDTMNFLEDEYPKKIKTTFLIGNQENNDQAILLYELLKDSPTNHVIPIFFTPPSKDNHNHNNDNDDPDNKEANNDSNGDVNSLFNISLNNVKNLISPILQAYISEGSSLSLANIINYPSLSDLCIEMGPEGDTFTTFTSAAFPGRGDLDDSNRQSTTKYSLECINPNNPVYIVDTSNNGYKLLACSIRLNFYTKSGRLARFITEEMIKNLERRILNEQGPDYYDQVREGLYNLVAFNLA